MKYSTKLIYKTCDKGYAFLSFLKRLEDKYGRKLIDLQQKQEQLLQKLLLKELTGDLTGNKIADKITSAGKTKRKEKEDETNKREEIQVPPEKKTTNIR